MPTKTQVNRIRRIIDFLENEVHPKKFDVCDWVTGDDPWAMSESASGPNSCNTAACVVGWLPYLFPRSARWHTNSDGSIRVCGRGAASHDTDDDVLQRATGLDYGAVYNIVMGSSYRSENPQPKTVAKRIREECEKAGVQL